MSDRTSGNLQLAKSKLSLPLSEEIVSSEYDANLQAIDTAVSAGGGTPAGSDTQVQFNDGGTLAGDSNFTWDKTNRNLFALGTIISFVQKAGGSAANFAGEDTSSAVHPIGPLPTMEALYVDQGHTGTGTSWIAGVTVDSNYNTDGTSSRSDGIFIAPQQGVGTENTAIRIADQGAGANDYALYSEGGRVRFDNTPAPNAANAAGTAGQIAWDSGSIYVCVATNTWKRAALSTW